MNTFYRTIFTFLMLVNIKNGTAQIPFNDPSWVLEPDGTNGGTEEFDSSIDYSGKWDNTATVTNGAEYNYASNLIWTGTTLKIKADTLKPNIPNVYNPYYGTVTYAYQGGRITSKHINGNAVYQYGYIEAYAKYPTSYYSLWPAFWLWSSYCTPGYEFYNELDIGETGAVIAYDGHIMGNGTFVTTNGCNISQNPTFSGNMTSLPLLSQYMHKFAIEWNKDRVIWYFDDVPYNSYYDPSGTTIPQHAMDVVFNFAIDPWYAFLPADWNIQHQGHVPTHWQQNPSEMYFEINYLHYYKLGIDCNAAITLCTPGGYDRKIKKSITTDNTCTPTYNPSTWNNSYTLRATDYVTLDAGTVIDPSGTGYFAIDIMPCPN